MTLDLTPVQPEIRAMARKIGWARRDIEQALQAHAQIERAEHKPAAPRQPGPFEPRVWPFTPVPKEEPRRSEPYRRWVASLPCMHCGREGPSQCAHSDEGKGMGLKAGDDTSFPLCADRPGERGCHSLIGASGQISRQFRRNFEAIYRESTQRMARATGHWPKEWD